jgi:hypothetical protein
MRRAAVLAIAGSLAAAGCGGGDDRPSREEARRCLERLDLHVTPRGPTRAERGSLEAELHAIDILRGRVRVSALYYVDEDAAERSERAARRSAREAGGAVERHGSLTLYWIGDGHRSRFAGRTRDCLV